MSSRETGLSIVVSSYNYGRYLRRAIDSALDQAWSPLQVIVVDDGSTDGSRAIIESYGDRIETLFQKNQGQIASCTAGLGLCEHDVVIFLDSDDFPLAPCRRRHHGGLDAEGEQGAICASGGKHRR